MNWDLWFYNGMHFLLLLRQLSPYLLCYMKKDRERTGSLPYPTQHWVGRGAFIRACDQNGRNNGSWRKTQSETRKMAKRPVKLCLETVDGARRNLGSRIGEYEEKHGSKRETYNAPIESIEQIIYSYVFRVCFQSINQNSHKHYHNETHVPACEQFLQETNRLVFNVLHRKVVNDILAQTLTITRYTS